MRKIALLLTFFALILTIALTSCDDNKSLDESNSLSSDTSGDASLAQTDKATEKETFGFHLHSYGEWKNVKEPTCTESGSMERVCACGDKKVKSIASSGHVAVTDPSVAATCTAHGKTEGTHCIVCNAVIVPQELIPASHSFGDWVTETEPTCTTEGLQYKVCSKCGERSEEVLPSSHNYVESVCSCGAIKYAYDLEFAEVDDGYSVCGIGECKDYYIYIPAEYKGKPVTEIGVSAFSGSGRIIEKMFVPASVKRIGKNAFLHNTSFGKMFFAENSQLESIGEGAFNASDIYSLKLPEGLKTIGDGAFVSCDNLTELHIPASLKSIGNNAFRYFNENCKIYVSDIGSWCEIKFGNDYSNPMKRTGKLYDESGNEFKDIDIPEGVTEISRLAFYGGKSITRFTFPTTLKKIGSEAFYDCVLISEVYIKDLTAWCNASFDTMIASRGATFYLNGEAITDLVIPQNVTSIGGFVFGGCSSLKSLTMHDGVTQLGTSAFMGCSNLENITLSKGLIKIANNAFQGNKALKSIQIPEGITTIGDGTFKNCTALTDISLPESLTTIEGNAFSGCTALAAITIPSAANYIGEYAFENCTALKNVYFDNASNWYWGSSPAPATSSSKSAEYLVEDAYREWTKK